MQMISYYGRLEGTIDALPVGALDLGYFAMDECFRQILEKHELSHLQQQAKLLDDLRNACKEIVDGLQKEMRVVADRLARLESACKDLLPKEPLVKAKPKPKSYKFDKREKYPDALS